MSDPTFPADWETKHAFMRARGLVSAKWMTVLDPIGCKNHEVLTEAVCGPAAPTDSDRETQPSISPQERERRERLARRAIVARSSGGPVPRLDVDD